MPSFCDPLSRRHNVVITSFPRRPRIARVVGADPPSAREGRREVIQHQVDDHAGHRDVHPDRPGELHEALVARRSRRAARAAARRITSGTSTTASTMWLNRIDEVDDLVPAVARVLVRARRREPDQVRDQEHRRRGERRRACACGAASCVAARDRDPAGDRGSTKQVPLSAALIAGWSCSQVMRDRRGPSPRTASAGRRSRRGTRCAPTRASPERRPPRPCTRTSAPSDDRGRRGRASRRRRAATSTRLDRDLHDEVERDLARARRRRRACRQRLQAGGVVVALAVHRDRVEVRDLPEEQHAEHREAGELDAAGRGGPAHQRRHRAGDARRPTSPSASAASSACRRRRRGAARAGRARR